MWHRVAGTVRPLGSKAPRAPVNPPLNLIRELERVPARPKLGLGSGLDGGWERRLRTGAVEPDRTLDLHGLSVDQAWHAIDRLLDRAWTAGDRLVLLVTGRERPGGELRGRGQIRARLTDWLAASRHAPHIAAIRSAHRRHGGAGALYLILRRR